jgi:hypothetical protein
MNGSHWHLDRKCAGQNYYKGDEQEMFIYIKEFRRNPVNGIKDWEHGNWDD